MADNSQVHDDGVSCVREKMKLHGWNMLPDSKPRGIDIIADKKGIKIFVKVKAISKKNPVPLGKSLDTIKDNIFWIVINNLKSDFPNMFILHSEDVKNLASKHTEKETGFWLRPKEYRAEKYREKWYRLSEFNS